MDGDLQRKAQRLAKQVALFRAELAELEQEPALGLTQEQRSCLDAQFEGVLANLSQYFGADAAASTERVSWGMRVASLLGAVAFGSAAVLFLHRFWGSVPPAAQVALLVGAPLLLLAGVELTCRYRVDSFYTALVALAAVVAFIVELNALGSVMNIASSPHALLVWSLFSLLVAYAYGLRLLLSVGLFLLCAYTAAFWTAIQGGYWASFLDRAELLIPAAVVLYAIPWVTRQFDGKDSIDSSAAIDDEETASNRKTPGSRWSSWHVDGATISSFSLVYRICGAATGLTGLLIFSTSGHLCCWGVPRSVAEVSCQIIGMVLSAGVIFHGLRLGRSSLVSLGAVACVVFLYVRLHSWWWHWMPKYLFFSLIGLMAIGLFLIFRRLRARLA